MGIGIELFKRVCAWVGIALLSIGVAGALVLVGTYLWLGGHVGGH